MILILKLLLFTILLNGQIPSDIFEAIHLNDKKNIRNKSAKKIIEKKWIKRQNDEVHYTWIEYRLNEANKVTEYLKKDYDHQDSLKTEVYVKYTINEITEKRDSSYFTIKRYGTKFETTQTTVYGYDAMGHLHQITIYSIFGGIISQKDFEVNDDGYPIKVETKIPIPHRQEIAEYDYENNNLIVKKSVKNEASVRVDTLTLFPELGYNYPTEKRRYNLKGDMVYEKNGDSFIHYEYKYDTFENWVIREKFLIDLHNKSVRRIEVIERNYVYR